MWKSEAPQKVTMAITATMAGKARMMKEMALRADVEAAAAVARDEPGGAADDQADGHARRIRR